MKNKLKLFQAKFKQIYKNLAELPEKNSSSSENEIIQNLTSASTTRKKYSPEENALPKHDKAKVQFTCLEDFLFSPKTKLKLNLKKSHFSIYRNSL